jgi:hypothetical protein
MLEYREVLTQVDCVAATGFWRCPEAIAMCDEGQGFSLVSAGHQTSIRNGPAPDLFTFQLAGRGTDVSIISERQVPNGFMATPRGTSITAVIKEDPANIPVGKNYVFTAIARCIRLAAPP